MPITSLDHPLDACGELCKLNHLVAQRVLARYTHRELWKIVWRGFLPRQDSSYLHGSWVAVSRNAPHFYCVVGCYPKQYSQGEMFDLSTTVEAPLYLDVLLLPEEELLALAVGKAQRAHDSLIAVLDAWYEDHHQ